VCSPNILDNIGCIEVLVLRCAGPRNAKTVSAMNMDGATDFPFPPFGLDSQQHEIESESMYDDRGPFLGGHASKHRPPPPIPSYRSPYAETDRSHDIRSHSRHSIHAAMNTSPFAGSHSSRHPPKYSEPISPGARPPVVSIPSEAFQYGSGPIPTGPMMGSERSFYHTRPASAVVTNAPGMDPAWLNELLTKAVKRGVEESRRSEPEPEAQRQHIHNVKPPSQLPGAWPQSPSGPGMLPVQSPEHAQHRSVAEGSSGTITNDSDSGWGDTKSRKRIQTHVNWSTEPDWDGQSKAGAWSTPEETASDTWDTDETWGTKKPKVQQASLWSRSEAPTIKSRVDVRDVSPVTKRNRHSSRSERDRSRRSRSKSRLKHSSWGESRKSSFEDRHGWTHAEAMSDSVASTDSNDDTAQPARSPTHIRSSKHRSRPRSRTPRPRYMEGKGRRSSFTLRSGAESRATSKHRHASSVSGPTPIFMKERPFVQSSDDSLPVARKASSHAAAASSIPGAPPIWIPDTIQTSYRPPAPFSIITNGTKQKDERRDKSSPKWESSSKSGSHKHHKEKSAKPKTWLNDNKAEDTQDTWANNRDNNSCWGAQAGDGWGQTNAGGKVEDDWTTKKENADAWGTDKTSWEFKSTSNKESPKAKEPDAWGTGWDNADTKKDAATPWDATADPWTTNNAPDEPAKKDAEVPWDPTGDAGITNNASNEAMKKDEAVPSETTADAWNNNDKSRPAPAKDADSPWNTKNTAWNNDKPGAVQWSAETWASTPAEPKPASTSKRHTTKSLSKYRHLRPTASDTGPKSHWQFPPSLLPSKLPSLSSTAHTLPAEPLHKLSISQASQKGVEHQVRAGTGTQYGHAISRPEYLDTLEKPYAVFRFKYRSRAILKGLFGEDVVRSPEKMMKEKEMVKEKERLKDVSKEELIGEMVRLKMSMEGKEKGERKKRARSENTESVAMRLTESWVERQSREASEKGKGGGKKGAEKGWKDPNKW
jgi:hypothetical protein